jgi:hypothetical protein
MQHIVVINLTYPGQAMLAAKSPWLTHAFGSLEFTCQDHLIYHDSLQLGDGLSPDSRYILLKYNLH